jgi:type I restriction enzyme M protein
VQKPNTDPSSRTESSLRNSPESSVTTSVAKIEVRYIWLKDDSLEDSASLPDPDVLAGKIVEDLQAGLDEFALIAADLRVK